MFEKLCAIIAEQFDVDVDTITADTAFEADLQAEARAQYNAIVYYFTQVEY